MRWGMALAVVAIAGLLCPEIGMAKGRANRYERAAKVYERTWDRAAPLFGLSSDTPAPYHEFLPRGVGSNPANPNAAATMGPYGPDGRRGVKFARQSVRSLGVRPRGKPRHRQRRREGQLRAVHEWAHLFQPTEVLNSEHVETGAAKFSARAMRDLYGHKTGGARLRRPQVEAMDQEFGPESWRRAQFGENYGKDPATLYFPGYPKQTGPYAQAKQHKAATRKARRVRR